MDYSEYSKAAAEKARREGVIEGLGIAEKCVPTSWLDSLLSGPEKVLTNPNCREIEALLRGVQDRIRAEIERLKGGHHDASRG